jgi:hypothetical protein
MPRLCSGFLVECVIDADRASLPAIYGLAGDVLNKARRVDEDERIVRDICERVDTANESQGITFDVATKCRVEVSVAVLMQSRRSAEDLSREPQVVGEQ